MMYTEIHREILDDSCAAREKVAEKALRQLFCGGYHEKCKDRIQKLDQSCMVNIEELIEQYASLHTRVHNVKI